MGEVWSSILHSPLTAAMRIRDSKSESFATIPWEVGILVKNSSPRCRRTLLSNLTFTFSVVCKSKDFENLFFKVDKTIPDKIKNTLKYRVV